MCGIGEGCVLTVVSTDSRTSQQQVWIQKQGGSFGE